MNKNQSNIEKGDNNTFLIEIYLDIDNDKVMYWKSILHEN